MHAVKVPDTEREPDLERLIRQYQGTLLRVCYLYLHDEALAEDAAQETFLKAYRNWGKFHGEASEKTWLTRICINTCKDMLRSAWFRRVDRRVTAEELPGGGAKEDPAHNEIAAAVMNLPRKLREAVILYYYQNEGTQEIASILGISQPAVSGRLKRAREKLREMLEGREEP